VRDESGRCRPCGADEVGEAIGRIATDRSAPESAFDGYTDRAASERKILRDVFAPGDAWFRSGDLMRRDAAGFFHFVDRIGDTFRWRGENVSTAEVEAAVAAWPEVRDAVVYGVEVPGAEGRAGMAAVVPVVPVDRVDLAGFAAHLAARLPVYARPVFVRVVGEIEATSTFKPKRRELARCGFDPRATTDALFVHDRDTGAFIPLDAGTFERIHSGHLRI
jgi:fatty-acyl-CoA synthase